MGAENPGWETMHAVETRRGIEEGGGKRGVIERGYKNLDLP